MHIFQRCTGLLIVFVVLFVGVGSGLQQVRAEAGIPILVQNNTPKCWPLDVVLLVDQSYSMFSYVPLGASKVDQNPPSDPDGYRFDAAKEILDRLIQNRQDECPQAVHRFGMITFGHQAINVLNMVQIDLSPTQDATEWSETYTTAIFDAAADRSQMGTDPHTAFRRALGMLQSASDIPTPEGYGLRRQIVILLTDGSPDGVGEVPTYMCNMVDDLTSSEWSNTSIWGLALNASKPYLDKEGCDGSIRDNFSKITSGETKTRKGQFISLEYNRQAIPSFVSNVVSAEFGHPGIAISCGEVFYVDPYLEQAVFAFFRDKSDDMPPVTLSYLGQQPGEPLFQTTGGQIKVSTTAAEGMNLTSYKTKLGKEEITFSRPRPGAWRFDVEGLSVEECKGRVIALEEPIKPIVTLINPRPGVPVSVVEATPFRADDPTTVPVVVQLQAKDGSSIANENQFPLQVTVNWTLPNGITSLPDGAEPQTMTLSPAPGDLWVSDMSVAAPYEGSYQLTISGDTLFGSGREGNQIFTESFTYTAKHIEAFGFEIEMPKDNDRIACNQVIEGNVVPQGMKVRLAVKDSRGETVDGKKFILSDLSDAFEATLQDKNGNLIAQSVKLKQALDRPGVFEAEIPIGTAENLMCGETRLQVAFLGNYAVDQFALLKDQQTLIVNRVRAYGVQGKLIGLGPGQNFRLHSTFRDACPGGLVAPITFDLEVRDLEGNLLDPKDVAVTDPTTLYTGKLIAPDGSFSPVDFELADDSIEPLFSASAGSDQTAAGEYRLEIRPNPSAFKAEFVPAEKETAIVNIRREDTFLTKPLACNLSISIAGLLGAILVGLAFFGLTGGPGGTLEIIRSNESSPLVTLQLSRARWFSRAKSESLEELGIAKIQYRKDRAWSDEKKRAVRLSVQSVDGEDVYDNTIESDERQALIGDFDVRYN